MNIRQRLHASIPTALLVLALGATLSPTASAETSPYKTITLDNGLQVVVIENRTVPLVTIDITVRTGGFTEPNEFAGLSHLYEHMFFKANAANPSQEGFMNRVRELGISFNGYTSDEVVTYFFTLPSRNLDPGMRFMADAIQTPLFNQEELEKEREVVIGEFDRNEAGPTFVLGYALDSAYWMPYVSRKQPLGQRQVILTATVDKMRMIQNLFYIPNNAALVVSGDVNAEEVFALARKYLSGWKAGTPPFPSYSPPAFPPLKPEVVIREANIPYVDMRLFMRGPSVGRDDAASYAATLLATMVNQPTSRLYHRLVDSGLALGIFFDYRMAMNVGTLRFIVNALPDNARQAYSILKEEIAAMGNPGYFSEEEIAIGKEIVSNKSLFEQDNPQAFAIGTTARWWSMSSLDYYINYPSNVAKVRAQDLQNFIGNYITGKPRVLGVGMGKSSMEKVTFSKEDL
jgi:zinc protease